MKHALELIAKPQRGRHSASAIEYHPLWGFAWGNYQIDKFSAFKKCVLLRAFQRALRVQKGMAPVAYRIIAARIQFFFEKNETLAAIIYFFAEENGGTLQGPLRVIAVLRPGNGKAKIFLRGYCCTDLAERVHTKPPRRPLFRTEMRVLDFKRFSERGVNLKWRTELLKFNRRDQLVHVIDSYVKTFSLSM